MEQLSLAAPTSSTACLFSFSGWVLSVKHCLHRATCACEIKLKLFPTHAEVSSVVNTDSYHCSKTHRFLSVMNVQPGDALMAVNRLAVCPQCASNLAPPLEFSFTVVLSRKLKLVKGQTLFFLDETQLITSNKPAASLLSDSSNTPRLHAFYLGFSTLFIRPGCLNHYGVFL